MRYSASIAALLAGCSILYDGHDIHVLAPDPGAGAAQPCDADGDGYARPGCPSSDPPDCDDTDPNVTPWPPHQLPVWSDGASTQTPDRLRLAAYSPECAVLAYIDTSVTPARLVSSEIGSSCREPTASRPDQIPCGSGHFDELQALDVRAEGATVVYSIAGLCDGAEHVRVIEGDPMAAGARFDVTLAFSDPVRDVQHLDDIDGVLVLSSTGEVDFVNGLTTFAAGTGVSWLRAAGAIGVTDEPSGVRTLYLRDRTAPGADFTSSTGRAALLRFASSQTYGLILPSQEDGRASLEAIGPFAEGEQPTDIASVGQWSEQILGFDPLIDGVAQGDEFLVVGRNLGSIDIQHGQFLDDRAGFTDARDAISLPVPESGLATDVRDLAIEASPADGNRYAVFAATSLQQVHTTHFEICPEPVSCKDTDGTCEDYPSPRTCYDFQTRVSACPTVNEVGTCTDDGFVFHYYSSEWRLSDVMEICSDEGGTFTAG